MKETIQPGICRHCRCTESDECRLECGDPCGWTNPERTVCSNPGCIVAEERRLRQLKRTEREEEKASRRKHGDRFVNMGYGVILEELRKDDQKKRRKRKAA